MTPIGMNSSGRPSTALLAAHRADGAPNTRTGHHHQPLALREASGRRALGEPGDAPDDRSVHAALDETADRATLHDDVGGLHEAILCGQMVRPSPPVGQVGALSRTSLEASAGRPARPAGPQSQPESPCLGSPESVA
jgi:hypothetical protein